MDKKAFTLIELLVVIAVLGVLVLLAAPRFLGYTQKAELTKGFTNARTIEKASELYYMDHEDWPRLTDEPYTSEEIESFAEELYGITGEEVNLDPDGNYYDIDYDKLSGYVQVPDDKKNYILQNPIGKVYYMENLTEVGVARVSYSSAKEEDDSPIGLRNPIAGEIVIDSAEELAKIGQSGEPKYPLDGKYILTANINLSEYSGEGWTPIGNDDSKFTGSFDGNGYSMTGLTINRPTERYVGLFGYTEGAIISNVGLTDNTVTGSEYVGGVVGYASSSTISNSYATGTITGTGTSAGGLAGIADGTKISNSYTTGPVKGSIDVGGLVGIAIDSIIDNSYATGSVESSGVYSIGGLVGYASSSMISNSYATGSVTGANRNVGGLVGDASASTEISNSYATGTVTGADRNVGGLVGLANLSAEISNSYATGSVTGRHNIGGFVGRAQTGAMISNSYATGEVTGLGEVGGLVGLDYDSTSTVTNSYWDKETMSQSTSAKGEGKTTSEMKLKTTYSGWDFDNVWRIDEGNDYPKLR